MSDTGDPRIEGSATRALTGATLGFFVGFAAVSLFGPTAQLLKDSMGLGPAQVGLLVAVPSATGSVLRIPFGAWVDTTGGRTPFLVLLGLSAAGLAGVFALLVSQPEGLRSEHYLPLLGLGMLAGCGIAVFSVGIGQVSYWYPHGRQGAPLAVYAGLGNVAPGLFALLLPLAIGALGITSSYALWLGLLLVGIAAYAWLAAPAPFFQLWKRGRGMSRDRALEIAREAGQELLPGGSAWEGLKTTARLPQMWVLVGLYFTSFGGFLALTAWFPTHWSERFGVGLGTAGALTMVYSVLTSVVRVPGGFLSDHLEGERTALLSFGIMGLGALSIALGASVAVATAGAVVMAVGMGIANAAVFKMVPSYLAVGGGGAGAGWVGGLGASGGFVLPPVLGALVARFGPEAGYVWGFGLFALLAVLAIGLTALLSWRWGALSRKPVSVVAVRCPVHGEKAQVWAQAVSGEIAPARLLRCSLLPGELGDLPCPRSCMSQVEEELGEADVAAAREESTGRAMPGRPVIGRGAGPDVGEGTGNRGEGRCIDGGRDSAGPVRL